VRHTSPTLVEILKSGMAQWADRHKRCIQNMLLKRLGKRPLEKPKGYEDNVNTKFRNIVQTVSGAHPVSYPMRTRSSFSGDKAAGG
jgi:hypothetical protein